MIGKGVATWSALSDMRALVFIRHMLCAVSHVSIATLPLPSPLR